MRISRVALLGALAPGALSHNLHGIILVNGTDSPEFKYVLDVDTAYPVFHDEIYKPSYYNTYKVDPILGPDNPNITCGRGAFKSAATTETADILAGSEVGFRVSTDGQGVLSDWHTPVFWHPGPAQIYLSRAPNDDLVSYKGDGDWFKIAYAGPRNNSHWMLWPSGHDFNFTIPLTTPPGKYLMRIENFMPTDRLDYQQFYVNCAFVNIIGSGGGTPMGFAKFPGAYKPADPGILVPPNQVLLNGVLPDSEIRLTEYTPPGPAIWTG